MAESAPGAPTGVVSFLADGVALRDPVPVDNNGRATATITFPTADTRSLVAAYRGDATFLASTSVAVTLVGG